MRFQISSLRHLLGAEQPLEKSVSQRPAPIWAGGLSVLLLAIAASIKLLYNGKSIFDLRFADETSYLSRGVLGPEISFYDYEYSPLYSDLLYIYSLVFKDNIDVYLIGGVITTAVCITAIAVAIFLLSRSVVVTAGTLAFFVCSGAMTIWPRVSYPALSILALGLGLASVVRPLFAKSGILLAASFLMTFIRPEFVLSFYLFGCVVIVALLFEVQRTLRSDKAQNLFRHELLPGWLGTFATLALIQAWTFPIISGGQRSFLAFGQHFALRFVEQNNLALNPWLNYRAILDSAFPGAQSVAEALSIAPGTMIQFWFDNLVHLLTTIGTYFTSALSTALMKSGAIGGLGFILILLGIYIEFCRVKSVRREAGRSESPDRREYFGMLAGMLLFMIPPGLAATLIYPRDHYVIFILLLLWALAAVSVHRLNMTTMSIRASIFAALGLILVTPVLPKVDQPELRDIEALRQIPNIRVIFEADLGWCVYYQPHCQTFMPAIRSEFPTLEKMLEQSDFDTIVIGPGMRAIAMMPSDPTFRILDSEPEKLGYELMMLPSGRKVLKKIEVTPPAGDPHTAEQPD